MNTPPDRRDPIRFEVANRLFFRLYQCSNLMHKNGTRHMADFGATTQQWAVLGALARPLVRDKGMSVKDLIEFLLLSRQNLTAVLDRLVEGVQPCRDALAQSGFGERPGVGREHRGHGMRLRS